MKLEPTPEEIQAITERFSKERLRFVNSQPFLGSLLLHLKAKAVGNDYFCAACDLDYIYLNCLSADRAGESFPATQLSPEGFTALLGHELWHPALGHCVIPASWDQELANVAQDAQINRMMSRDGFYNLSALPEGIATPFPDGGPYKGFTIGKGREQQRFTIEGFDTMHWTAIYWYLVEQAENKVNTSGMTPSEERAALDEAIQKLGATLSELNPLSGDVKYEREGATTPEFDAKLSEWEQVVLDAIEVSKTYGSMSADMTRTLDSLLEKKVNWVKRLRTILKNVVTRTDYSWIGKSSMAHIGYFPVLKSRGLGDIVFVLDTSGSMRRQDLEDGIAELKALRKQFKFRLHFFCCDAAAYDVYSYDWYKEPNWDIVPIKGGGGTNFIPIFENIKEIVKSTSLSVVVIYTDTEGKFPEKAPNYPVIWVSSNPRAEVSFGDLILTQ